jgi:anthranilate synthase
MEFSTGNCLEFKSRVYTTYENIDIVRRVEMIEVEEATSPILESIDDCRGALFSSSYDYPGRYTQWDIGFVNPALEMRALGREFSINALKASGCGLLRPIFNKLSPMEEIEEIKFEGGTITGKVKIAPGFFPEELRSKQPTIFSIIRALKSLFGSDEDKFLGLYGAFGYDLVFQFEPVLLKQKRENHYYDLVLYLPDQLVAVDHRMSLAYSLNYSFNLEANGSVGLPDETPFLSNTAKSSNAPKSDQPGQYAVKVRKAMDYFARGDFFEVVPSQKICEPCLTPPLPPIPKAKGD